MIFFYIFNILLCLWMAKRDANLIKKDKKVSHAANGAIHLALAIIVAVLYGWPHFIAWLCEAAIVFDVSLSLFRGLNPFYVSPNPKSKKDKIEKRIFGNNGFLPKLVYLIIFILCLLIPKLF